jgi:hypothetical protein
MIESINSSRNNIGFLMMCGTTVSLRTLTKCVYIDFFHIWSFPYCEQTTRLFPLTPQFGFRRTGEMIFVSDAHFCLENLMLKNIGDTILRTDAINCLTRGVIGITRQSPSNISKIATNRQFADWFTKLQFLNRFYKISFRNFFCSDYFLY